MDRFTDSSLMTSMASALAKIRAVLPPDRQDHVTRLERSMSLPSTEHQSQPCSLFVIQKALTDRTVLRISYRNSGAAEASRREIEPLGLTYYADRWHLIAWCRARHDYRDFRTDRIQAISSLSEQFEPREGFSLATFSSAGMKPTPSVTGSIRVDSFTAERIRKEAPFKILHEERDEQSVTFRVEGGKWDLVLGLAPLFRKSTYSYRTGRSPQASFRSSASDRKPPWFNSGPMLPEKGMRRNPNAPRTSTIPNFGIWTNPRNRQTGRARSVRIC